MVISLTLILGISFPSMWLCRRTADPCTSSPGLVHQAKCKGHLLTQNFWGIVGGSVRSDVRSAACVYRELRFGNTGDEGHREWVVMLWRRGARSRDGAGILVQRLMDPHVIIGGGKLAKGAARWASLNTIKWSTHSRRIVPIDLSANPFCHARR
jgi:hypothetical protein